MKLYKILFEVYTANQNVRSTFISLPIEIQDDLKDKIFFNFKDNHLKSTKEIISMLEALPKKIKENEKFKLFRNELMAQLTGRNVETCVTLEDCLTSASQKVKEWYDSVQSEWQKSQPDIYQIQDLGLLPSSNEDYLNFVKKQKDVFVQSNPGLEKEIDIIVKAIIEDNK